MREFCSLLRFFHHFSPFPIHHLPPFPIHHLPPFPIHLLPPFPIHHLPPSTFYHHSSTTITHINLTFIIIFLFFYPQIFSKLTPDQTTYSPPPSPSTHRSPLTTYRATTRGCQGWSGTPLYMGSFSPPHSTTGSVCRRFY